MFKLSTDINSLYSHKISFRIFCQWLQYIFCYEFMLFFSFELWKHQNKLFPKIPIYFSKRKGIPSDHDCLKNTQISNLSQYILLVRTIRSLRFVGFDTPDEVNSRRVELVHKVINFFWKFIEDSLTSLVFHSFIEKVTNNFHDFFINFVLIFTFESSDTIINRGLRVKYLKFCLIDLIKHERRMFYLSETLNNVRILELRKSHIVDDRKERKLTTDHTDYLVVSWRQNAQDLLLETVLTKDLHFTVENVIIV